MDAKQIETERLIFRNALLATQDGKEVLTWLGNECGAWSQDPAKVKPELLSLWNRLLGMLGVVRPDNLFEIVEALKGAVNDNDLVAERRRDARREEAGDA